MNRPLVRTRENTCCGEVGEFGESGKFGGDEVEDSCVRSACSSYKTTTLMWETIATVNVV